MADQVIEIKNPELLEAFKTAPKDFLPYLTDAMQDVLFIVQGTLGYAGYPASTAANMPGRVDQFGDPLGYYERGRGWWYPVKRHETLGGKNSVSEGVQTLDAAGRRHKIKVKHIAVVGYKLAKNKNGVPGTSEVLGKSWTTRVTTSQEEVQGEVGTPVTYANNVQGFDIPEYMQAIGWLDMDTRLAGVMPEIEKRLDNALADYLADFGEK